MRKISLLSFFLSCAMICIAQPARISDPFKGIMVDKFVRVMNSSVNAGNPQLDMSNSILGVDADHDNIYENEVKLIEYCNENHITHLSLYDVRLIFKKWNTPNGPQEIKVWDGDSNSYQLLRWHLCRFITYAKTHGIKEIAVSVTDKDLANESTEEFKFSDAELNNPSFNSNLLAVQNSANNGNENTEILKFALRTLDFNNSNPCNIKIDGFTYEEEFWNASVGNPLTFQYVSDQLREIYHIKQLFNAMHPTDTIFIQLYFARANNNNISRWPQQDVIDYLDGSSTMDAFHNNNLGIAFPSPHPRLIDRFLNVYYKTEISGNEYNGFQSGRIDQQRANSNYTNTVIVPLFSVESRTNGGDVDLLGNWLQQNPSIGSTNYNSNTVHNIFSLEECFYNGYQTTYNSNTYAENNVLPGSAMYFASSMMLEELKHPEIFYINTPPTSGQLIVEYCGPIENLNYDFVLTNSLDAPITSTVTNPSPVPVVVLTGFTTNGTTTVSGPTANLAVGSSVVGTGNLSGAFANGTTVTSIINSNSFTISNAASSSNTGDLLAYDAHYKFNINVPTLSTNTLYFAKMTLHYSNGYSYTYRKPFHYYNDANPHLEIIDDTDPLTASTDSRCEGEKCFVQIGGDISSAQYRIDNDPAGYINIPLSLKRVSFETAGIHTISVKKGTFTEDVVITIKPNPTVQIFPDCSTLPNVHLTAYSLGNGSLYGSTYLWSTGEHTPTIIADQLDYATSEQTEYNVTVTNINGCSRTGKYGTAKTTSFPYPQISFGSINIANYNCAPGSASVLITNASTDNLDYVAFLISNSGSQIVTFTANPTYNLSFTGLKPGDYKLFITPDYRNGWCPAEMTFTIGETSPLVASSNITGVTQCSGTLPKDVGAIDLTISGSGYQYNWSNGATTQDISNLYPGTYQVEILDGSCKHYYTYEVPFDYGKIPVINYITTEDATCIGSANGNVRLYASQLSCPTCLFDLTSSFYSCQGCNSFPNQIVAVGNHSITITDPLPGGSGCSSVKDFYIGSPIPVTFTSSTLSSCTSSSEGAIHLNPSGGSGTYSISCNPSTGTITGNDITGLAGGTYTVTISDQNCITNSSSVQLVVNSVQCCTPTTITYPVSGTEISTMVSYTSQPISVNGDIIISNGGTLTLNTCTLSISAGRKITILQGGYLKILSNSLLQSCGTQLWKGINIQPGGKLDVNGSSIQNAEFAIKGDLATQVTIDNSIFDGNYISIYYPYYGSPTPVSLSLKNSQFKCTSNLKSPYPGQTTISFTKPYAGIILNDMASVSLGGTTGINSFENMNSGIILLATNADLSRMKFTGIKKYDNYSYPGGGIGCAIYGNGKGKMYTLKQTGRADISNKDFKDCYRGIHTVNMGVISSQNYFQNCDIGYFVSQAIGKTTDISNNNIDANIYGISLYMNNTPKSTLVKNNIIEGGTRATTISGALSRFWGIRIDENRIDNKYDSRITGNEINLGSNSVAGIEVKGTIGYHVDHNYVTLNNGTNRGLQGISLYSSDRNDVSCNSVSGTNNSQLVLSGTESAFKAFESKDNTIGCNNATNVGYGYYILGGCSGTKLVANDIGNHYTGMYYTTSGTTGDQLNNGNYWYMQSYSGMAAKNENSLGAQNEKYYYYVNGPNFTGSQNYTNGPNALQLDPASWFQYNSNFDQSCGIVRQGDCNITVSPDDPNSFANLILIAQDQISALEYNDEVVWNSRLALYRFLLEFPTYKDSSAILEDYYTNMAGTMIQKIAKIDLGEKFPNRQSLLDQINYYSLLIYQNSQIYKSADSLLQTGGLTGSEVDSLKNIKKQTSQIMGEWLNYSNEAYKTLQKSIKDNVDLLNGINSQITGSETYIQNQKSMNDLYLKYIVSNKIDSLANDSTAIRIVAEQCPLSGGKAVFLARSLYQLINPTANYNDEVTCVQSGQALRSKPKQSFKVYPNPASSELSIDCKLLGGSVIKVFNILGELSLVRTVENDQQSISLDVSRLQNGFYTINIFNSNDDIIVKKSSFVIAR